MRNEKRKKKRREQDEFARIKFVSGWALRLNGIFGAIIRCYIFSLEKYFRAPFFLVHGYSPYTILIKY